MSTSAEQNHILSDSVHKRHGQNQGNINGAAATRNIIQNN